MKSRFKTLSYRSCHIRDPENKLGPKQQLGLFFLEYLEYNFKAP
jgi:hypothetical protein